MTKDTKLRKREPRASLKDVVPFTADSLRQLLQTKVLRGKWKMPSGEALAELARILEGWRQYYLGDQITSQPLRELQHEARTSADQVLPAVEGLTQRHERGYACALHNPAPSAVLKILRRRSPGLADVQRALGRFKGFLTVFYPGMEARTRSWLADVLPVDFANAMESTNPNFKTSYGTKAMHPISVMKPTCPGVEPRFGANAAVHRFIAAVVSNVTGERPTEASVATRLKTRKASRMRKNARGNFSLVHPPSK